MLCEVVYISAARLPFTPAALEVLLHKARSKNATLGITGMLIHLEGSFLQVLEGPDSAVTSLFETIARDVRHGRVLQLFRTSKKERSFGEWTMGYVETSARTSRVLGFNDFFRRGF